MLNRFSRLYLWFVHCLCLRPALLVLCVVFAGCGGSESSQKDDLNVAEIEKNQDSGKAEEIDPYSPPTDQQVIADTIKNGKNILEVIPSSKPGSKSWSSIHDQYFWQRGLVIRTRSKQFGDAKDVVCEIGGFARYEITAGRYNYREFKTQWVEYEGVPRPTDEEIMNLIDKNKASFFRGVSSRMVNPENIKIKMASADNQEYTWHNPKSLSCRVEVNWDAIDSSTEVSKYEGTWEVRIYRDALDQPWVRLITNNRKSNKLETTKFTADEVRSMQTLSGVFKDES